jgi:hypothetical protein
LYRRGFAGLGLTLLLYALCGLTTSARRSPRLAMMNFTILTEAGAAALLCAAVLVQLLRPRPWPRSAR